MVISVALPQTDSRRAARARRQSGGFGKNIAPLTPPPAAVACFSPSPMYPSRARDCWRAKGFGAAWRRLLLPGSTIGEFSADYEGEWE